MIKTEKIALFFIKKRNSAKDSSLKIIDNIFDKNTKNYIGSVILSYLIYRELQIVAQSKPIIQNLINENLEFEELLNSTLQKLVLEKNVAKTEKTNFSYLDMLNGLNYFAKPITDVPFALVVNIHSELIKK